MRTTLTMIATIALLAVGPAAALAGGGGGGGGPCRAYTDVGPRTEVVLRDFCFDPVTAPVVPGTELTVVNEGEQPHTLTAVDGSFDTGTLQPGETATVTVEGEGLTPIYCTLHASKEGDGMAGTLVLDDDTSGAIAAAEAGDVEGAAAAAGGLGAATAWMWLAAGVVLGLLARTGWRRLRPGTDGA